MQWPIIPIKNLTSLFPLIFLSKHISLYALGSLKWILDIVWPLNQHFNLKNGRNWRTTFFMLRFLIGIICILLHRPKKLTLRYKCYFNNYFIPLWITWHVLHFPTGLIQTIFKKSFNHQSLRKHFAAMQRAAVRVWNFVNFF